MGIFEAKVHLTPNLKPGTKKKLEEVFIKISTLTDSFYSSCETSQDVVHCAILECSGVDLGRGVEGRPFSQGWKDALSFDPLPTQRIPPLNYFQIPNFG